MGLCFVISFWEKIPVFYLGRKIFLSQTQLLAESQGFDSSIIFPAYQILFSLHVYNNKKIRLMCHCMKFCFFCTPELSSNGSELPLVIISTMILDSIENIRLRKGSPYGQKVLFELFASSSSPRFQYIYLCCLRDPQLQNFAQSWAIGWWSNYIGLHYKRDTHKCDKCHFQVAFLVHFSVSWSPLAGDCNTWLSSISLLFTATYGPTDSSEQGKHRQYGPSLPVAGYCMGSLLPLPVKSSSSPCWSEIKRKWLLIFLEPFRVIIVSSLNHFEDSYNTVTVQFEKQGFVYQQ